MLTLHNLCFSSSVFKISRNLPGLFVRLSSQSSTLRKTDLYDYHVAQKGKMVPFAGWSMPVEYADQSIVQSHLHTRKHVSIFDVSHMLQTKIFGRDNIKFVESLVPADVANLHENTGTLSVFTNGKGGIRDDLIVSKTTDGYLYMVTNAGCSDKDIQYLKEQCQAFRGAGGDVSIEHIDDRALLAVQGPEMATLLRNNVSFDLDKLFFMHTIVGKVFGVDDCRVTRCGYTGEDGVEISVKSKQAVELCEKLMKATNANVKLAGLGPRDSLRLEAGLCLYGNDIDETTTPVEAGLAWLIAKRRRETKGFPGADVILNQLTNKNAVQRRRIGLIAEPGKVGRAGAVVYSGDGKREIGRITSGCPSPSLKKNVAMAYVESASSTGGMSVRIDVGSKSRPQLVDAKVTKMPFVSANYYASKAR